MEEREKEELVILMNIKHRFINVVNYIFCKESRIMFGSKKDVIKPDMVISICLCKQHKDFCTRNGKLMTEQVVYILRLIGLCRECRVEIK